MKGLLIKDLRFTMQNKKMLGVLMLVAVMMLFMQKEEGISFIISYMTMVCGMLVLNTISIDEFDKSTAFLMTMPVTRGMYAAEKYVFALCCNFAGWLLSTGACLILYTEQTELFLMPAMVVLAVFTLFQMVILPVQLKFGGDKGRIVLVGIAAVLLMGAVLLKKIGEMFFESQAEAEAWFGRTAEKIDQMNPWIAGSILAVIWLLVLIFSYRISKRIMEKKEF